MVNLIEKSPITIMSTAMRWRNHMSEINSYLVSQTREIIVTADSLESAIVLAQQAFRGTESTELSGKPVEVWGYTSSPIKETDITVREAM